MAAWQCHLKKLNKNAQLVIKHSFTSVALQATLTKHQLSKYVDFINNVVGWVNKQTAAVCNSLTNAFRCKARVSLAGPVQLCSFNRHPVQQNASTALSTQCGLQCFCWSISGGHEVGDYCPLSIFITMAINDASILCHLGSLGLPTSLWRPHVCLSRTQMHAITCHLHWNLKMLFETLVQVGDYFCVGVLQRQGCRQTLPSLLLHPFKNKRIKEKVLFCRGGRGLTR